MGQINEQEILQRFKPDQAIPVLDEQEVEIISSHLRRLGMTGVLGVIRLPGADLLPKRGLLTIASMLHLEDKSAQLLNSGGLIGPHIINDTYTPEGVMIWLAE